MMDKFVVRSERKRKKVDGDDNASNYQVKKSVKTWDSDSDPSADLHGHHHHHGHDNEYGHGGHTQDVLQASKVGDSTEVAGTSKATGEEIVVKTGLVFSKSSDKMKLPVEQPVATVPRWKKITAENLDLDYCILYSHREADDLFIRCEKELDYNTGQLAKVQIFGKWHNIPRKQVAHGEAGLNYTFSNNTVPARPWTPLLIEIRDKITEATGHAFNFVLINRYNDGKDHMGEHRDDEKDLERTAPIASLTLGQSRDFIFKHCEARGKQAKRKIDPVKIVLEHGCLLMMNHPTNTYWYHALPVRKGVRNVRINMTFRRMVTK